MALSTLRIIGFILGIFLITLAISMLIPMLTLIMFDRRDDLGAFGWSSLATGYLRTPGQCAPAPA
jgi:trk system potassium uptake protein TrkH